MRIRIQMGLHFMRGSRGRLTSSDVDAWKRSKKKKRQTPDVNQVVSIVKRRKMENKKRLKQSWQWRAGLKWALSTRCMPDYKKMKWNVGSAIMSTRIKMRRGWRRIQARQMKLKVWHFRIFGRCLVGGSQRGNKLTDFECGWNSSYTPIQGN